MDRIPPIKAVMTAFPNAIDVAESLEQAARLMSEHGIHHLPVLEAGKVIGVLSARDLEFAAGRGALSIRDVYEAGAYVVGLHEPLDRVLLHMAEHHVDCAIVARNGKPVGIFTASDVCLEFGRLLRTLFPPGVDPDQVA